MAKKASRDVRIDQVKQLYGMYKAQINSLETTKANIAFTGYFIFESELAKFAEKNPEVNMEDFTSFLKEVGAYHKSSRKGDGTGKAGGNTSLNTKEKASEVGVTAENLDQYLSLINAMVAIKKDLQKIIPSGSVTVSIPKRGTAKKAE